MSVAGLKKQFHKATQVSSSLAKRLCRFYFAAARILWFFSPNTFISCDHLCETRLFVASDPVFVLSNCGSIFVLADMKLAVFLLPAYTRCMDNIRAVVSRCFRVGTRPGAGYTPLSHTRRGFT